MTATCPIGDPASSLPTNPLPAFRRSPRPAAFQAPAILADYRRATTRRPGSGMAIAKFAPALTSGGRSATRGFCSHAPPGGRCWEAGAGKPVLGSRCWEAGGGKPEGVPSRKGCQAGGGKRARASFGPEPVPPAAGSRSVVYWCPGPSRCQPPRRGLVSRPVPALCLVSGPVPRPLAQRPGRPATGPASPVLDCAARYRCGG
jgi:hypothetical protein